MPKWTLGTCANARRESTHKGFEKQSRQRRGDAFYKSSAHRKSRVEYLATVLSESDISAKCDGGKDAWDYAKLTDKTDVLRFLATLPPFQRRADDLLFVACRTGHFDIAKDVIRGKCDVNKRDTDGHTALMIAAYYIIKHLEIIQLLLTLDEMNAMAGICQSCKYWRKIQRPKI